MTDLNSLIAQCIEKKRGDKEFALFYSGRILRPWLAMIGNQNKHAMLGETGGDFEADGRTALEAVKSLLHQIEHERG